MSTQTLKYEDITNLLERHSVLTDAAEIHGMLVGMLAGGMALDNQNWMEVLQDFTHQGDVFADEVKTVLTAMYNAACQELIEADFALVLNLPDDASPIVDRGQALINWVQGFMAGFGVEQNETKHCSDDVKEGLRDFSEIVQMDADMPEDEESEQALFEVMEYVRVTAMLCFNELGNSPSEGSASQPLH